MKPVPLTPVPIEWAAIPAGVFCMGSPSSEADRYDNETPHMVTLEGYYMSKYAITFDQYDAYCDEMSIYKPNDKSWGRGNRPVIGVSWEDAVNFAKWMGCRLPTEAEWEYACRAGTTTSFNTGISLDLSQANYYSDGLGDRLKTLPVGSFAPNAWGLYDMHGNVQEWCQDWFTPYPKDDQANPNNFGSCSSEGRERVIRGGSYSYKAFVCRSAFRNNRDPRVGEPDLGFRIVYSSGIFI